MIRIAVPYILYKDFYAGNLEKVIFLHFQE